MEQLRRPGRHGANLCRRSLLIGAIDPDDRQDMRERLLEYLENYSDDEMAVFLRTDRRVIGSDAFAARFSRRARAASMEVPARERRLGTPPLTALLAESLQRGDGLAGGVRDAHAALYEIVEIAGCAGLSPKVVAKMVRSASSGARGRGTRTASLQT